MNQFFSAFLDKDKETTWGAVFQQGFFKPYESMRDFGKELAAPLCMPMICLLGELFLTIQIAAHLLQALTHLLVVKIRGSSDDLYYEPDAALENLDHIAVSVKQIVILAAAFVILPVLGAVSIITRLLATGYESYSLGVSDVIFPDDLQHSF